MSDRRDHSTTDFSFESRRNPAKATSEKVGFVDRVFSAESGDHRYLAFIPHRYRPDERRPAILFLHGSGESGDDGKLPAEVGLGPAIRTDEANFPFVVVFPQCETIEFSPANWSPDRPDGARALAMLDQMTTDFAIDLDRIHLTGLSMGGFGVWSLAARYPERWASIAPICGGGDLSNAAILARLPTWCFHGDADDVVGVELSRKMINAIVAAGGSPRYDELPGVGHHSWEPAYRTKELFEWMLEQRRST
jgi:predicted peptidase